MLIARLMTAVLAFTALSAAALECKVASGPTTRTLVELYTSEGCSSCPPADRWLSSFATDRTDPRVVPIAFHVNYWDSLGWKDPFGDARYTTRQSDVAKAVGARFVYTPQVVVGGHDTADWRNAATLHDAVERNARRAAGATLEISATVAPDGSVRGSVDANLAAGRSPDHLELVVVPVQDGLSSRVTAGENRGEHLKHDFVVRDLEMAALKQPAAHLAFDFKARAGWTPAAMSVAAFVQDTRTGEVLQALSTRSCSR